MTLPDKELLRRGEVLRGTGWSRQLLAKFVLNKIIGVAPKFKKKDKSLYFRSDVASAAEKLKQLGNQPHENQHPK